MVPMGNAKDETYEEENKKRKKRWINELLSRNPIL